MFFVKILRVLTKWTPVPYDLYSDDEDETYKPSQNLNQYDSETTGKRQSIRWHDV